VVRGEPIGSVVVVRFNEAGQAARIVVKHRPLPSVLLWSQLMGEHFAGTRYAQYFLTTTRRRRCKSRRTHDDRHRRPVLRKETG
jgi:hypothetical protein